MNGVLPLPAMKQKSHTSQKTRTEQERRNEFGAFLHFAKPIECLLTIFKSSSRKIQPCQSIDCALTKEPYVSRSGFLQRSLSIRELSDLNLYMA